MDLSLFVKRNNVTTIDKLLHSAMDSIDDEIIEIIRFVESAEELKKEDVVEMLESMRRKIII